MEGIVSMVREILSGGKVRRIELDVGLPIKVLRDVSGDTSLEEPGIDIDAALRKAEMIEFTELTPSNIQTALAMDNELWRRNVWPSFWVVSPGSCLEKWVEVCLGAVVYRGGQRYFLNIPIQTLKSLPDDVLILCGSIFKNGDVDDVSFAVKTSMEIREHVPESIRSFVDPSWDRSKKRHSPVSGMEIIAGRLRAASRGEPSKPGK
jgi:hypothetical protein